MLGLSEVGQTAPWGVAELGGKPGFISDGSAFLGHVRGLDGCAGLLHPEANDRARCHFGCKVKSRNPPAELHKRSASKT